MSKRPIDFWDSVLRPDQLILGDRILRFTRQSNKRNNIFICIKIGPFDTPGFYRLSLDKDFSIEFPLRI
jgi:hypothetical protein